MLHAYHHLTPEDCAAVSDCLPYTAHALIAVLGAVAACKLLNARPGATIVVPKHPDANPAGARAWAELAELIGEPAMVRLSGWRGGEALPVPVCQAARNELRARAIRAMYDRLTREEGRSGRQAIYAIGIQFAPITSRAIEMICGRADAGQTAQPELF
jgi:hypothetical protein